MRIKKNKLIIFSIFNALLIVLIIALIIPFSNYLKKINLEDNEFVKNQKIINPELKTPEIKEEVKVDVVEKAEPVITKIEYKTTEIEFK